MEDQKHWANSLKIGDKVIAFIRNKSDGSKNFRSRLTVIENDRKNKTLVALLSGRTYTIPYNDLVNKVGLIL